MSLNQVLLNGRLPRFEGTYKAGEGDKKAFLSWSLSVKRDFKAADEQYYPEDLIPFKAFGPKADFINKNFNQGDGLILTGRIQKAEDYEKDGQMVRGGLFLNVETISFAEGRNNGDAPAASSNSGTKSAPAKTAPAKSGLGGAKKSGLGGKKLGLGGKKPL